MTNALTRLADAVDAGTATEFQFYTFRDGLSGTIKESKMMTRAYKGSLDAAKALHEAVLPGWIAKPQIGGAGAGVTVWHCTIEDWDSGQEIAADNLPDPARAWLLAILRALAQANPLPEAVQVTGDDGGRTT